MCFNLYPYILGFSSSLWILASCSSHEGEVWYHLCCTLMMLSWHQLSITFKILVPLLYDLMVWWQISVSAKRRHVPSSYKTESWDCCLAIWTPYSSIWINRQEKVFLFCCGYSSWYAGGNLLLHVRKSVQYSVSLTASLKITMPYDIRSMENCKNIGKGGIVMAQTFQEWLV